VGVGVLERGGAFEGRGEGAGVVDCGQLGGPGEGGGHSLGVMKGVRWC